MTHKIYVNKEELFNFYINQKKSISEVAKIFRLSKTTIFRNLKKNNIKVRTLKEAWITQPRYFNKETRKKISLSSIKNRKKALKDQNYINKMLIANRKSGMNKRKLKATDKELYNLYWDKNLTPTQIAKIYGVSTTCVNRRFYNSKIKKRSYNESIKYNCHNLTEEGRNKVSTIMRNRNLKNWKIEGYRKKMSDNNKKLWKDHEFSKRMFESMSIKPNKPESVVIGILNDINSGFNYNYGDYNVDGKIPDFINEKDKKVIEIHGRAFHDPNFKSPFSKNIPYHRTKKGTKEFYKDKGYSCLVIWDSEINNIETFDRIKLFCELNIPKNNQLVNFK
jgi:G:T-mismatch repair DNA endonuclease (very short patch repair protein)/predicted DNA-binding protein YlxM (UPF0122 family)